MWLCSVSLAPNGVTKATAKWNLSEFLAAEQIAHKALAGVGNPEQERAFRMNITFCIHRALNDDEIEKLPETWECSPGGLAGGPVAIIWTRGIPHRPAAMPCENPGRMIINKLRPDLWVPEDCEKCDPCLSRKQIQECISVS